MRVAFEIPVDVGSGADPGRMSIEHVQVARPHPFILSFDLDRLSLHMMMGLASYLEEQWDS